MDEEQFDLWEASYLQGINEVATYDQCANENVLNTIFTHFLLPECYHYEPFADYTKDDFQRLRCLWMMFGYFVLKRRDEWKEVMKRSGDVKCRTIRPQFRQTLFGCQFKEFLESSRDGMERRGGGSGTTT
jgi:hypothetical protein